MEEIILVDEGTRAALRTLADRLGPRRDDLSVAWMNALQRCQTCASAELLSVTLEQSSYIVAFILDALHEGRPERLLEESFRLGANASDLGFSYTDLVYALHHFEEDLLPFLLAEFVEQETLQQVLVAVDSLVHDCIARLAAGHYQHLMAETVQHNRELVALNAISEAMTRSRAPLEVLNTALEQVLAAVRLQDGEIWLLDEPSGQLLPKAWRGVVCQEAQQVEALAKGEGVPALVARAGRPIVINDLHHDARFRRRCDDARQLRSVVGVPLVADNRLVGVMNLFSEETVPVEEHDLTFLTAIGRQIALAVENVRLHEELRRHARELEEAHRRRERFISMVAHDFRDALAVIHGFAQMLSQRGTDSMETRAGGFILAKTTHLTRLVGDLQDVSRIEAGRFAVRPDNCDIVALARDVVLNQQNASQSHTIVLEAAPEAIPGRWDADRLQQVLNNLVSNAVKYSQGAVVQLRVESNEEEVTVSVRDEGPGLRQEEISQLFLPYSRLERDQKERGTGLGLFISKGIVEAHGGRIWAQSAPDQGSTFSFTLPRRMEAPAPAAAGAAARSQT